MHVLLYQHQNALADVDLTSYAEMLGIDAQWAVSALLSHAFVDRVREDVCSGVRSGIGGTPTSFINGIRHDGAWDERSLQMAMMDAVHAVARR